MGDHSTFRQRQGLLKWVIEWRLTVVGERVAPGVPRVTAFVWTAEAGTTLLGTPLMPDGQGRANSINDPR